MKKSIILNVHLEKGTNNYLLNSHDVFNFIGESTSAEVELFHYIDQWCDWLNYYFLHTPTCNSDVREVGLRNWIYGYNYAKKIDKQEFDDRYCLTMRGYNVTIFKPYTIKDESK